MSPRELWFDSDHADAVGQTALEVHEDFRPRKSTLGNQAIQKCGAVATLHVIRAVKKFFEHTPLPAQARHIRFEPRLLGTGGGIGAPYGISVPCEHNHQDEAQTSDRGGRYGTAAVTFERGRG